MMNSVRAQLQIRFNGKKFSQISPSNREAQKGTARIDHQEGHEAERRIRQSRIGVAVKNLQSGD
jgi:hypothetical protein